jgi:hypothetical protein
MAGKPMDKLTRPDQGEELARELTRERIKRSKLKPEALSPNDPDLDVFRNALRSEKLTKPGRSINPRIIKNLA